MNWRIPEWFPDLSSDILDKLIYYRDELVRWNSKINLVAPSTLDDADRLHFADSVMGCEIIIKSLPTKVSDTGIYDIGSGNGFPGLILAILNPKIPVYCVESNERKGAFLRQLSLKTALTNVKVYTTRVESLPSTSIMFGMSRAFSSISKASELTQSVFNPKGTYFHFKGPDWKSECDLKCSTWNISELGTYNLPGVTKADIDETGIKRFIICSRAVLR